MKKQRFGIVIFTVFITSAMLVAGFFSYLKISDTAMVNRSELDEQNKLLEKYSKLKKDGEKKKDTKTFFLSMIRISRSKPYTMRCLIPLEINTQDI